MTKKWTKEEIKSKLMTNDKWLVRGLIAIYEFQTADEQNNQTAYHDNGVGFNAFDAEILSSIAQQAKDRKGRLSRGQITLVRDKLPKYAGQLTKIANGIIKGE